jgi:hypothetical protein
VHEQPRTCNCNSRLVMRGKLLASCRPRRDRIQMSEPPKLGDSVGKERLFRKKHARPIIFRLANLQPSRRHQMRGQRYTIHVIPEQEIKETYWSAVVTDRSVMKLLDNENMLALECPRPSSRRRGSPLPELW